MYEEYFGFNQLPFSLTPNTQFYLNARVHQEALNLLNVTLPNAEGFIKLVGEVGTGKTMLCRKLLASLDEAEGFVSAYIPNPYLSPQELRFVIADELSVNYEPGIGQHQLTKALTEKLVALAADNKQVVLVVDEAQAMPRETLEALRLMTNIETETAKLLQVVLFGQPELDEMLAQDDLRQLRQRITFSYHLEALDQQESASYLQHRLRTAGFNGTQLFDHGALKLLYRTSAGVPRLINILAHKSLMSAYGKGDRLVRYGHVKAAVQDTEGVSMPSWLSALFGVSASLLLTNFDFFTTAAIAPFLSGLSA